MSTATVGLARRTDPETSHLAAASVSTSIRESQRIVFSLFKAYGDMTDEKLLKVSYAGGNLLSPSGLRTRRSELVRLGLLEDSGQRIALASGRKAIVWRVKQTTTTN